MNASYGVFAIGFAGEKVLSVVLV